MEPFPAKGIRFNDCLFTEPTHLASWTPPHFAGLLVVQIEDEEWAPRKFQPVFFAEFGNNSRQPIAYGDYSRLTRFAGMRPLYVAVLPMPFTTTVQRCALRDELIWAYNPAWQRSGGNRVPESTPEPPRRRIGFLPDLA
ncbi:MAG TPA: hypothetical protein VML19_18025 [Verrucomicrobiae bacterium]|nr:hypothetical protein [Verrucomicrobiae bacterium]